MMSRKCYFGQRLTRRDSMDRNAPVSPLLRIPAELRVKVYEHVLYDGTYRFACQDSQGMVQWSQSEYRHQSRTHN
jgi:hypothetical protein